MVIRAAKGSASDGAVGRRLMMLHRGREQLNSSSMSSDELRRALHHFRLVSCDLTARAPRPLVDEGSEQAGLQVEETSTANVGSDELAGSLNRSEQDGEISSRLGRRLLRLQDVL